MKSFPNAKQARKLSKNFILLKIITSIHQGQKCCMINKDKITDDQIQMLKDLEYTVESREYDYVVSW